MLHGLLLFLVLHAGNTSAVLLGDSTKTKEPLDTSASYVLFQFSSRMPHFQGGEDALRAFINKHLIYPDSALKARAEGTVYVSFVVVKNGELHDIRIKKGAQGPYGPYFDKEALRLLHLMPLWEPGMKDRQVMNIRMEMPLKFHLTGQ